MVDNVRVRVSAPLPKIRARVLPSLLPTQIELRNTGTAIQWRYIDGSSDWQDLIDVADMVPASAYLDALKTVDGSGSGLDADLLDGHNGTYFQPQSANLDSWSGVDPATTLAEIATDLGLKMVKSQNLNDVSDKPTARQNLSLAPFGLSRTQLKALDTTKETIAFVSGRVWVFTAGNYTAHVAADTIGGMVIKANAIAASVGAWIAIHEVAVPVEAFDAVGDATTDDYTAISVGIATLAAFGGGTLLFGDKRYRHGTGLSVQNDNIVLAGTSKKSALVCDLSVATALKYGDAGTSHAVSHCRLRSLEITRAAGTPSGSSVGILFSFGYYFREDDVLVQNHGINRSITGVSSSLSLGYDAFGGFSGNAVTSHLDCEHATEVNFFGGELGRNGNELYDTVSMLRYKGNANSIRFVGTMIIPRGPGVSKPTFLEFVGMTNATGVFSFIDCLTENVARLVKSDATTTIINDLWFIGGRYVAETTLFALDALSNLYSAHFNGVKIAGPGVWTLPFTSIITNCVFVDPQSFVGGSSASLSLTNNYFHSTVSLSGAWTKLAFDNTNTVAGAITDTSTGGRVIELGESAAPRNDIVNPDFSVWQRGTSFSSPATGAYTADRWRVRFDGTGATRTISQQAHTLGQTTVPGNPKSFLRFAQSVAGSGGSFNHIGQPIEDVATHSGETVTVSLFGEFGSTTSLPSIILRQNFGTGGSPSSSVDTAAVANVSVGTTFQRLQYVVAVPSVSGKTLGSNGDDCLELIIVLPINTTFTFDVSHVSLTPGDTRGKVVTFAPRSSEEELALCQRRCWAVGGDHAFQIFGNGGIVNSSTSVATPIQFPVKMAKVPSLSISSTGDMLVVAQGAGFGVSALSATNASVYSAMLTSTISGGTTGQGAFLEANNTLSARLVFSAEF